jgi:superfamily II DNA helicase RecQ
MLSIGAVIMHHEGDGLPSVFGILRLRDNQKPVVKSLRSLRSGESCVVVIRTGGGESVCCLPLCLSYRSNTPIESDIT